MSARDVVDVVCVLLMLASYVAAAVLAVLGWLTKRPDSAARFMLRLWCFITLGAAFECADIAADRPWNWVHWAYSIGIFVLIYNGVQRNWKKAEAARKSERAVENYRPTWLPK